MYVNEGNCSFVTVTYKWKRRKLLLPYTTAMILLSKPFIQGNLGT
jgi:hypothetical protein